MTFVTVFAGGIALERVGPKIWVWYLLFCKIKVFPPKTSKRLTHIPQSGFISILYVYFCCPESEFPRHYLELK
jgi:hypothetical protein